jgi:PAS domain S-box-containing protein
LAQYSDDFLNWTLEQTKTGMWTYHIKNNEMWWNEAVYQITDCDKSVELSLEYLTQLFIEEQEESFQNLIDQAISSGNPWNKELKILTPTGKTKWVHTSGRAIVEENEIVRLESIFSDVDDKKSAELELQNTLRNFGSFDKALNDYLIVTRTDAKGVITYGNENFCRLSQYSSEEIISQPYSLVNSGYHSPDFWEDFWTQINDKKAWQGEFKNKAKDGTFYWVDSIIIPILDQSGEIMEFVNIHSDISERKVNESIVNESEKLALVGETTAQIFHDVMNPLTVILLSAQKMRKKLPDDFDRKPLQTIISSVQKVKDMFQEVRDVLLQGDEEMEGEIQTANLNQTITKALELVCLKLEQFNVEVHPFQMEENINVIGSELQYTQVLINLINNSIDAIRNFDSKWVNIKVAVLGEYAHVAITDSGQGIPENNHEKIFSNLFSTKKKEGGTGLGLGICRKILRRYGGDVNINRKSLNTSFIVSFKVVEISDAHNEFS